MNNTKNILGLIGFILILLLFIVGGYFLMDYMLNKPNNDSDDSGITEIKEIRIDDTKEYVYFENTEDILHEEHISKEDAIINIKGFESINEELHSELEAFNSEYVSLDDVTLNEGETCSNESNLYSFPYREYTYNVFGDYISLVINDFTYNCLEGSEINNIKSYIINKENGETYTEAKLLETFEVTDEEIITLVEDRLHDTQVLDGDTEVIDVNATINSIRNNEYGTTKALSISKTGELELNFVVISNRINYNDTITIS